jgi:DNA-binding helix-hairpin-helix protein with protein kinase domain
MNQTVRLSNGADIEIDSKPFASGGEADIHEIVSPGHYAGQVLKIFKTDKRTGPKEAKLKYLTENKPNLVSVNGHHSVIWPLHIAYVAGKFVGYSMPKANGIKLECLCTPKMPPNLAGEWNKFAF